MQEHTHVQYGSHPELYSTCNTQRWTSNVLYQVYVYIHAYTCTVLSKAGSDNILNEILGTGQQLFIVVHFNVPGVGVIFSNTLSPKVIDMNNNNKQPASW